MATTAANITPGLPQSAYLIPQEKGGMRKNNLDLFRLLFAVLVVWSHSFALWYGNEDREWLSLAMGGEYNSGNVAVLGFFAISGFLITMSWEKRPSAVQFWRKRIGRIYPGYLVAITICSIVVVPLYSSRAFDDLSAADLVGLLSNLLLKNFIITSDAFNGGAVNGSLWSIRYEFLCYIGVAALGVAGALRYRVAYPVIAIAVMAVKVWLDLTGRRPSYAYFWFSVLPPFMIGGTIYLYRDRLPRNGLALTVAAALVVLMANSQVAEPYRDVLTRTMFPPVFCYGIFYLAFDRRLPVIDANRFGDLSYGCYLYAFPIQQMLAHSLKGTIGFPIYVSLSVALSLCAGFASYFLIEKHFHKAAPHSLPKSAARSV
jgi:peptidoglycan/LPS O-acetylase OafA/YrhL